MHIIRVHACKNILHVSPTFTIIHAYLYIKCTCTKWLALDVIL